MSADFDRESTDFDWAEEEDWVVLHEQPATAVYRNKVGAVVIRQQREWNEETDSFIVLQPANVRLVALSMLGALGMSTDVLPEQPVEDTSAGARRQRRYRKRHQGVTSTDKSVAPVTPSSDDGDAEGRTPPLLRAVVNG